MKKVFTLLFFVITSFTLSGQDRIVNNDGTVFNCKITGSDSTKFYFETLVDGYTLKRSISKNQVRTVQFGVIQATQTAKQDPSKPEIKTGEQKIVDNRYRFFLVAGFSLASYKGNTTAMEDSFSGSTYDFFTRPRLFPINFGLGFEKTVSECGTFQGSLIYAPKGVVYQGVSDGSYSAKVIFKTNYIEAPVSFIFAPVEMRSKKGTQFYLKGGIAPAVMIVSKMKSKTSDSGYGSASSQTMDLDITTPFDFCTVLGLGAKAGDHFRIECVFDQGTRNLMDSGSTDLVLYNRVLSFNCSYLF